MIDSRAVAFDSAAIDTLFRPFDSTSGPGLAVGVALRGVPLYRKGFGLANMELPMALTAGTRMRIGSASKHFTSLALLLLAEEGSVSLDDPLKRYLPEMSAVADQVTLRQLMGHISGLRCSLDLILQLCGVGLVVPAAEQLQLMARQDAANFAPGESWCYSNGGYALLSLVIERITRQPLEAVLEQRIFRPAGMHDTLLRRLDHDFVPNSASLHVQAPDGTFVRGVVGPTLGGEGGVVSTVDDMLRWLAHMDAPQIGSADTWAQLRQPLILNNGSSTGYGLGLASTHYRGLEVIYHSGGVLGGASQMLKVPELGLDIVVMTNASEVDPLVLTNRIIDACVLGLEPLHKEAPGDLLEGYYQDRASGTFLHLYETNGQQMVTFDGISFPLRRRTPQHLVPAFSLFQIAIDVPDESEGSDHVTLHSFGRQYLLQRLEPDAAQLPAKGVLFESAATQSYAEFIDVEGTAYLRIRAALGGRGVLYDLEHIGPGIWKSTPVDFAIPILGGLLELATDHSGFTLTTGRTRRLRFQRQH